ncbi:transcription termination factor 5, mitochondrial isoform X1 [Bombus huntii]|uniref:transcription termination factor 5, mitochondrial isoform X1 n=1 Tax=Bombus huntii TaxID=85661 RepID=UPI0021A9FBA5|nr:transcription termination factor 5, mitochondrial isoform X1 [Bombus huntii]XP_050483448.1 transcription termination factor 5, mitochondrial isoform X1 [Bombus huntii]XP_050483449.1 transcription termination factor 5, mitochondrial isoform X1 [Bombus huntii]XP_050483450.1 transcription termination factor 5, mitochondrial isoform X1 [Bombus huntii]XP_050483451.1 transcription termination factor 5, mitochondrial isoform X1 [Bombus huntii]
MLSQRFATKYVIKQFGKLISPFSTQIKIDDILTTYLKLDNNTIETLHEYEKKSKIKKISKNRLVRNCITLRDLDVKLEKNEYLLECLMLDPKLLRNRILVLKEMGIDSVDLSHIRRFSTLMHKSVHQFKKLHGISSSQSIMRTLFSNVGIKVDIPDQKMLKEESHMRIGSYYQLCVVYHKTYHMKLHDELFYKQKKIKYLSLTEMSRTLDVLKHKCQFDIEFLKQHLYLLNVDVDNVEQFLNEFKYLKINNKNIIEIIRIYPRILLRDASEIKELLQIFQNFEIPHESLYTTMKGLKIRKDTFLRRYISMENNLELAVWLKHPRVLIMIYFYKLVINRLTYMKHLNFTNNANINTYLSDKEFFSRFLEGDTYAATRKYLAYIVRKELGHDKVHVLSSIQRHAYWKYVSLTRINETIQYLKKHFSIDDICKNIQIILYPMSTIDNTLNLLYKECSLQDGYNYTPTQYLALCLYKLEQKHHFSGDGVWQDEMSVFKPNVLEDVYELDQLVDHINYGYNEVINLNEAAWLEHLLQY